MSRFVRRQIVRARPILQSWDIGEHRDAQDRLGLLGTRVMRRHVCFEPVTADFSALWGVPRYPDAQRRILYLHGGGYCAGSLAYAQGFGALLSVRAGVRTLCLAYRLAPERPFPAALEDALAAYRHILLDTPAQRIAVVGESAGGGLAFSLCHALKAQGEPLPGCVVGLSPWSDLTMSGTSYTDNAERDPALMRHMLQRMAAMYAGDDLANPLVSPLYGTFKDYPPALIFAGGDELLLDDARGLARHMQRDGSPCALHVEPDMWHVYVLYGTSEARGAMKKLCRFVHRHTDAVPAACL